MKRAWLVILAVALLMAACSDDKITDPTSATIITTTESTDSSSTSTTDATVTTTDATALAQCVEPGLPDRLAAIAGFISDQIMADYRTVRHDPDFTNCRSWYDWSTDDCSGPIGNTGPAFDFTHPCHRHDFGYRNYKRVETATTQDYWNEETKLIVDDRFLEDDREHCSTRPVYEKPLCLAWAQTYYWAVRAFGT